MSRTILAEIQALQQMTVGELRERWLELYGEPTRSRNRVYLWKRLAWRVQELEYGGLSDVARERIEALAPASFTRARTPRSAIPEADDDRHRGSRPSPVRHPKRPTPGTVLSRLYHGREIRVVTLDDGFEWEGRVFGSLSAVAFAVTGQKWNGRLFFGLTERKRRG